MCADVQLLPSDGQVDQAVQTPAMLAEPTRIRLLGATLAGERAAHELASVVGSSPTSVSQHLAQPHLTGLTVDERVGASCMQPKTFMSVDYSRKRSATPTTLSKNTRTTDDRGGNSRPQAT